MIGGFKARLNLLGGKRNKNRSELSSDLNVTGAYRVNRENIYGYSFTTQDVPITKPTELPPTLRPVKSTGNIQQLPKTVVNQNIRNSNPAISNHPRGEDQTNNTSLTRKELKFREKEQKKIEKQRAAQRKKEAKEKARQERLKEKARKEEQKTKRNANKKQGKPTQIQAQPQTSANNPTLPQTSTPVLQPVKTTPINNTKLPVNKTTQPANIPTPPVTETSQPANKTKQPAKNTKPPAPPANKTTQPSKNTTLPAYNTDRESSISRSSGPPPYSELPEPIQPKTDTTGNVVYSKPVDTGSWDIISQHREQMNRPAVSNSKRKEVVMDLNYLGGPRDNADNSEA